MRLFLFGILIAAYMYGDPKTMKKRILKTFNWLMVTAFFLRAKSSLYAPDIPASDQTKIFQVASSTVTVYEIALSTPTATDVSLARPAQSLKAAETFVLSETPRKILIPESTIPGNATFTLTFDNPAADIVTHAKIYDIMGAEVADLTEATGSGSNPTRLSWDGRDKNGAIVRSGIYIYQVQAGGSLINGTVVVAR